MTKTVTHIDCPKEWEAIDDYSSHRPLLWLCLNNTKESIVEFGCGWGSTNLIRDYTFNLNINNRRIFLSFETNKDWAEKVGSKYLDNSYLSINPVPKSLLFVDSFPGEERKYIIGKHSFFSDVIIIHDTEIGAEYVYGMSEILSTFKYRLDYQPEGKPHTTVVSNYINVTEWI